MKNVLLLLASVFISIMAAELIVRVFVPVREVGPVLSVQDRDVGKRLRPNMQTTRNASEFTMQLSTNSEGFRGPERRGLAKPILFLGDSFTMGYGVSDGYEFPAVVQSRLNKLNHDHEIEVVNAGIGNNGNGQWVKFLRRNLGEIDPSLIILQFMQNDFIDNVNEGYFSLAGDGRLIENEIQVSRARRLERALSMLPGLSNSHLYAAMREAYVHFSARPSKQRNAKEMFEPTPNDGIETPEKPYHYRLTKALVTESLRLCRSSGYPVLGLLVGLEDVELAMIRDIFDSHDVPVIVIPIKTEQPELYFKVDGHWNKDGHEYTARKVLEKIFESGHLRLIQQ